MYPITPVGYVESPYKEKFAVPRQPGLVPSATAKIHLTGEANCRESIRGIEQFSHLWLLFLFDKNLEKGWKPTVRPPRLGGNERIGVFASRATFRPNGIGMSAVKLLGTEVSGDQVSLIVGSIDLVDNTPIVDIKPYIPYSDAISDARGGYADKEPNTIEVQFSSSATSSLLTADDPQTLKNVIEQVLAQDPRPAYKKRQQDDKEYAVNLFDFNVKFIVTDNLATVTAIEGF